MKHFSEAELLDTYYTQPGESMPVMMHLADCGECAARYENLDRKLRTIGANDREPPEAFWTAQRSAIAQRIRDERASRFGGRGLLAAAAMLLIVFAGLFAWQRIGAGPDVATTVTTPARTATVASVQPPSADSTDLTVPSDPWESDALDEYQSIVAWESWDDETPGES